MVPLTLKPVTLTGRRVRLEPLAPARAAALKKAADDERIWPYMVSDLRDEAAMEAWLEASLAALKEESELPFAICRLEDAKILGSTRFMNVVPRHRRLEIGAIWLNPAVWRTTVNSECNLLMMTHAFEHLGAIRVEYRCDARNTRSREAILRLGAVEEGVLRRHLIVQGGFVRDTIQYSVVDADWPRVKAELERKLAG